MLDGDGDKGDAGGDVAAAAIGEVEDSGWGGWNMSAKDKKKAEKKKAQEEADRLAAEAEIAAAEEKPVVEEDGDIWGAAIMSKKVCLLSML